MNSLIVKYRDGFYRYNASQITNELLDLALSLLTTEEICTSDYYKEFIHEAPYNTYSGNAYYMERIDDYIVLGCLYSYEKAYLHLSQFENLMNQWRIAYADEPAEMAIAIDDDKNFIITYEKDNEIIKPTSMPESVKSTSYAGQYPNDDNYIEIEPIYDELYVFDVDDKRLNLFGYLLTSNILSSDYLEKLQQPSYEYYDDRYYLAMVEDRILIYDKTMEIKVLPPYDKFIELMKEWPIAVSKKPRLIRIYIENDYNLRIFILQPVAKQ